MLEKGGPVPEKEILRIMRQVALGLRCAHKQGLIHRDVKPDNIMIDTRGTIKVADLGLARELKENTSLTQTGMTLGTPHYVSPEQARGEKDIDHRADFYSLGAPLYHAVTGCTPFQAPTGAALMAKHLIEEPLAPYERNPEVELSDGMCALIAHLMKKDRNERPADAQAVVDEIDAVLEELSAPPRTGMARRTDKQAPVGDTAARR